MDQNYPLPLIGSEQVIYVQVSFETNEVGTFDVPNPGYRFKVKNAKSVVTKTVAGSNDGTITLKKSDTTLGTLTVAASSAVGDEDSYTSSAEADFEVTDELKITTAKSTAGGQCLLAVTLEVLPSHAS